MTRAAFWVGTVVGGVPQLLLSGSVLRITAAARDPADPVLYLLFPIFAYCGVVAFLSMTAGLFLLLGRRTNLFGKGLLSGTAYGAALFILVTIGVAAALM